MSGWTLDTLKQHYDQRFKDQGKAVKAALSAAKEATTKAENAAERRFDSVNEFRKQLGDQARTFMPRSEAEQRMDQVTEKVDKLEKKQERQDGKAGGMGGLAATLASIAALLIAAISVVIAFNK